MTRNDAATGESEVEQLEHALADENAWGEATPSTRRKSEKRQRGAMVSVRLTVEELEQVQARAEALGLTVSTFMRGLALGTGDVVSSRVPYYSTSGSTVAVLPLGYSVPAPFHRYESAASAAH